MKYKKILWKQKAVFALAAVLTAVSIPSNVMAGQILSSTEAADTDPMAGKADLQLPEAWAAFDFNQEAQNGKFTSAGSEAVEAAITGTAVLQDRDGENGKALYLNGSESWLTLQKSGGGSLLTGIQELTISFDAKPDRTQTNWAFYAAPDSSAPVNQNEHYIGALINGGKTTIERYNNNGSRPASASASTGTGWSHVDVVFTQDATVLYVDELKKANVASSYQLPDILGNSSIFQIGKANWGSGEYYKGWIDNFKIYKQALTDAQIMGPEPDDSEIVARAMAGLDIPNKDEIRDNIMLPSEIEVKRSEKKAKVTWKSSDPSVITDTEQDGKAAGMVYRTSKDETVKLTAEISSGAAKDSKEITVTVKGIKAKTKKTTSYLFAHFTGEEKYAQSEQIYFATSRDGTNWKDMTENNNPVLISDIGEKGVRDPYLLRSHDGDKFYLLGTDLSVYHLGWHFSTGNPGSPNLVVWESTDLVNWTAPRLVDVASKIQGVGCAWAPEAMYDEKSGNYVVYWATSSDYSKKNDKDDPMKMYYCTTRDFYTFTDPVLWIDRDSQSIIDTTMIYDDAAETYYRASGDGQITIEASKSIYEGWKVIGTLSSIFNNDMYSGLYLEGPEFFEYCEDDWLTDTDGNPVRTWGLICDQYAQGKGYLPFRSTDLADMTPDSWSPATDVNFGDLKKRHGTILAVTNAEYRAVMTKFGFADEIGDIGEQEEKDEAAANQVLEIINELGTVEATEEYKAKLDKARTEYEKLTAEQQELVNNYETLTAAEAKYDELIRNPVRINIKEAKVKAIPAQTYNGKQLQPSVTVTCNGATLKKGTDYTVNYSSNKNIGTAVVTITGQGNYEGTTTAKFAITVAKNKVYTVGNYKYKITNAKTNGKGTVTLTALKNASLKKTLKKINAAATVNIGGKKFHVTEIDASAFSGCTKAASATIGTKITKIGSKAFYNCKNLKKITIKGTKLKSVGSKAFKGINKKAVIKVPKNKLKAYKKLLEQKGQASGVKIKR